MGKLTSIGETLEDCPDNHDDRAKHDGPSSSKALIEHRDKWKRQNGTEGIAGGEYAFDSALWLSKD